MSATPRPWTVVRREPGLRGANGGYDIFDARNFPVLLLPDGEVNRQKADDIVHAVNTLDVMEEAREALDITVRELDRLLRRERENNMPDKTIELYCDQAKAVLARLKGGAE